VPRNDDGEFELILGNRQLMSVFFIVVILLGVFFAMGYIVGRNSSPVGAPEVAAHRADTQPAATDTPSSTRETTRNTKEPATPAPADVPKDADSQPKETASQQGPATKPAPPPEPAPAPAPVKASARAATADQPESGRTYLQLSAIERDKAEIMVELLRKKNFSAIAAEIPEKPGVFRVLVGPISEADINKTRAALQDASFPGKDAVKRTF
jgi:cell division septation protein DedD